MNRTVTSALQSPTPKPRSELPEKVGGGKAKEEEKEETENNWEKKKPLRQLDNLEYKVIGTREHTKAKRQVPGRVNSRLNICLSLSKLINPLEF